MTEHFRTTELILALSSPSQYAAVSADDNHNSTALIALSHVPDRVLQFGKNMQCHCALLFLLFVLNRLQLMLNMVGISLLPRPFIK